MAATANVIDTHPQRGAILEAIALGRPNREIEKEFGVGRMSVQRYKKRLPAEVVERVEVQRISDADAILDKLLSLEADAKRIGANAEKDGDKRAALQAVRELVRIVELTAKLRGELVERHAVVIASAPEWVALRGRLLGALAPYPEARAAVVAALNE